MSSPCRASLFALLTLLAGCDQQSRDPRGHPLPEMGLRAIIAGVLENNPANLERWISTPQSVVPGNAMPDIPMTPGETRDIAAFLYTRI
jgi:cytochrome c1